MPAETRPFCVRDGGLELPEGRGLLPGGQRVAVQLYFFSRLRDVALEAEDPYALVVHLVFALSGCVCFVC